METKTASIKSLETNSTPGEFTAIISAIGNVDLENDRVMPGAFKAAIENDPVPPTYWSHQHDIPPIGEGLDWSEKGNEIHYSGRLFVKGDVEHPMANMVYAGLKSYEGRTPALRQWSYTYGIPEGGAERVLEDGKAIRNLHQIRPVAEVGPCFLGMNQNTGTISAAKSLQIAQSVAAGEEFDYFDFFQLGEKAQWTQAYIDTLPDSAFLYVEPGGSKDATGKTTPRELRHFPYKDATGAIDMPHLRNADAQAPKASTLSEEVRTRVQNRAQRLLRAQEGKALLLGTIYSAKAWDDIEGYPIQMILGMLDNAVSYIQSEYDPGDVAQMQTIASNLLGLLQRDFGDATSTMGAAKAALGLAVDLYEVAATIEVELDEKAAAALPAGVRACQLKATSGYTGGGICHLHDGTDASKAKALANAEADAKGKSLTTPSEAPRTLSPESASLLLVRPSH